MTALFIITLSILLFFYIYFTYNKRTGVLRVLMYHHIKPDSRNELIVAAEIFEQQLVFMKEAGYHFITLTDLLNSVQNNIMLPPYSVLITFDDAYEDFYTNAVPLLKKMKIPSVVFVPVSYIGDENKWDNNGEPIMNVEQLKEISGLTELGIHCYKHINFSELTWVEIEQDLQSAIKVLTENKIPFQRVLAYPYGKTIAHNDMYNNLENMKKLGIEMAFRIGNRLNSLPVKNPYLIERIDVKGNYSLKKFKRILLKGNKFI